MSEFNPLEFAEKISYTINSGQLDDEKIKSLGRAIEKQSENLLDIYAHYEVTIGDIINHPTYRTLRESGILLESNNKAKLTNRFRDVLDNIAKKSYRQNVMPDIEEYKRELKKQAGLININEQNSNHGEASQNLENIWQTAHALAEALNAEMTSIEYTIYAELNNTYDLNSKRLILNSLMDRIKAQIQKISSLSRDELLECCQENHKVYRILRISLFNDIDQALEAFEGYLAKTATMLDSMTRQLNENKTNVWRLYKAIKQGKFDSKQIQLNYEDLITHKLGVGGLDFDLNTQVDVSDNPLDMQLLRELVYRLPRNSAINSQESSEQILLPKEEKQEEQKISAIQQWAFDYAKSNNRQSLANNLSVKEFWQTHHLQDIIEFKTFLSLILHTYHSDFLNDHIIKQKQTIYWHLFLKVMPKTASVNDVTATKRIIDARIMRYEQGDETVFKFVEQWRNDL